MANILEKGVNKYTFWSFDLSRDCRLSQKTMALKKDTEDTNIGRQKYVRSKTS